MIVKTIDAYRFGYALNLTEAQLRTFIRHFQQPTTPGFSALEGRATITLSEVSGIGAVAIKFYTRGGLIRHLIKRRYLKWGETRAQREYDLLRLVRNLSINAPEPIAYAYRGHLLYRAWLVTRQIPQPKSLAQLANLDPDRCIVVMKSAVEQIIKLVQNQIAHIDLHPGNVVVGKKNRVFLVDFDKGYIYRGNAEKLIHRYIARWHRAVVKHRLPMMLSDMLREGLHDIRR